MSTNYHFLNELSLFFTDLLSVVDYQLEVFFRVVSTSH
ncbi:hypothetical protein B4119_1759 [Parageobacillus caldoxylosilyticus]|uniref:Uncharacterized protein n=1 Tax=Saccharococcus caldoxylosilyticus TaxID=81408 RepID=A0A150LW66_9BACL|nr:hypothetical protein B4119_1759 [Parageobacillus caldoxylosilyticus]